MITFDPAFLIELAGAMVSALGVWLGTRRHPWCWPVGMLAVAIYGWVFLDAKLYSDALLQGLFALFILYGWRRWLAHLDADGRVQVADLAQPRAVLHLLLGALGALALGAFMHHRTDAALPWLDAALTAFSVVAQWWQVKRHTAAWWLWIAVDLVYIGEYLWKGLVVTAVLYASFVVLAVMGLREWQAARQRQLVPAES